VDERLRVIMRNIHDTCVRYGRDGDFVNYVDGANVGGFIRVAEALLDQGLV
jgi:glutamate dehydrogenase (NADP+)